MGRSSTRALAVTWGRRSWRGRGGASSSCWHSGPVPPAGVAARPPASTVAQPYRAPQPAGEGTRSAGAVVWGGRGSACGGIPETGSEQQEDDAVSFSHWTLLFWNLLNA
uniref:Uncharacterized protein n=1 Tax=Arundo donax TaxID=35708 RepID=A0A0A8ZY91_ARUDO